LVDAKKILARQIDPADLSPGEFASQVRRCVEEDGIRLVVIDSLTATCNR
jgi:circadian clock protein KaiC